MWMDKNHNGTAHVPCTRFGNFSMMGHQAETITHLPCPTKDISPSCCLTEDALLPFWPTENSITPHSLITGIFLLYLRHQCATWFCFRCCSAEDIPLPPCLAENITLCPCFMVYLGPPSGLLVDITLPSGSGFVVVVALVSGFSLSNASPFFFVEGGCTLLRGDLHISRRVC